MAKSSLHHPLIPEPPDYPMAEGSPDCLDSPISNSNPPAEDISMEPSDCPNFCGSPVNQPPSSAEPSSAAISDSGLLQSTSIKITKQAGLLNFFQKIPAKEAHEKWQKRKWENEESNQAEYAKRKWKDDTEKLCKQVHRCEQNRVSQDR